MSINQNSETSTHRRFIRINGKLLGKRFSRKADADRWYCEKKREKQIVESGMQTASEPVLVSQYAGQWMATRKAQGKPESSWHTDERRLRIHILPAMGDRVIQRITRREWSEFLDLLVSRHGLHPTTRNRVHALLRKMYNDALRQEIVTINPLSMLPKLKEGQKTWDYWPAPGDCLQYLEAAKSEGPEFRLFASLALNTGARVGELLALRGEDMQLDSRTIHIWRTYEQESKTVVERTKGRTDRWLGVNDALYDALIEHRVTSRFNRPADLLLSREAGRPYEEWMIRLRHRRTCLRAGVKPIRVHDLRHTYASHYVMNGGSLTDLQALLGHSSPMMTLKYAHLAPGHLKSKSGVVCFSAVSAPQGANVVAIHATRP